MTAVARLRRATTSVTKAGRCSRGLSVIARRPEPIVEQPRLAWARWISPETLISQVQSTAPYIDALLPPVEPGRLSELGHSRDGFLRIISSWRNILRDGLAYEEQLQDYFALCLACHHATVATFVPTDVDTKIRGIVWREACAGDGAHDLIETGRPSISILVNMIVMQLELAGVELPPAPSDSPDDSPQGPEEA